MDHPTRLTEVLKLHFADWHLARIQCLAHLIAGVFKVKTVNLTQTPGLMLAPGTRWFW